MQHQNKDLPVGQTERDISNFELEHFLEIQDIPDSNILPQLTFRDLIQLSRTNRGIHGLFDTPRFGVVLMDKLMEFLANIIVEARSIEDRKTTLKNRDIFISIINTMPHNRELLPELLERKIRYTHHDHDHLELDLESIRTHLPTGDADRPQILDLITQYIHHHDHHSEIQDATLFQLHIMFGSRYESIDWYRQIFKPLFEVAYGEEGARQKISSQVAELDRKLDAERERRGAKWVAKVGNLNQTMTSVIQAISNGTFSFDPDRWISEHHEALHAYDDNEFIRDFGRQGINMMMRSALRVGHRSLRDVAFEISYLKIVAEHYRRAIQLWNHRDPNKCDLFKNFLEKVLWNWNLQGGYFESLVYDLIPHGPTPAASDDAQPALDEQPASGYGCTIS